MLESFIMYNISTELVLATFNYLATIRSFLNAFTDVVEQLQGLDT